jgi:outer membrane protein OmpA-like peptidoglycan-associated protein/tetratricopeptide (TPR) repeat protein
MKAFLTLLVGIIIYSLTTGNAVAQSQAIKETFNDAEYFFNLEDYTECLTSYLQIYKRGYQKNANINYRIGICYLHTNIDKQKSIPYLETAVTKVSDKYVEGSIKEENAPYDAYLFLGNAYRINNQFSKAIESYEKYISLTGEKNVANNQFARLQIEACKRAEIDVETPLRVKQTNFGKPINNNYANYNPVVTANEKTIVFMSHTRFYEAAMMANKVKGKWVVRNITPEIQSDGDQLVNSITPDGKTLLLNKLDNFNSDIYISNFDGKNWEVSKPLNKEINTKYWESHACLSPDGNTLYFTSNRPESKGGIDIFYSTLDKKGQWGPAVNIGSTINTELNEETPFILKDGKTLFFSSQGHNSLGGYDVYYTVKQDDGSWSLPENVGYPVSTSDDDLFYSPKNKYEAYQALFLKGGTGELDLYKTVYFNNEHPFEYLVKGNISNYFKDAKPTDFATFLVREPQGNYVDSVMFPDNGELNFSAPAGTYSVNFLTSGFKTKSKTFTIPNDESKEEFILTPELLDVAKAYKKYLTGGKDSETDTLKVVIGDSKPGKIKGVLFAYDNYQLTPEAEKEIKNIAGIMLANPSLNIEAIGYTDSKGSDKYNIKLSNNRAKFVKIRLTELGISEKRITIRGLGKATPIAKNTNPDRSDNPDGRAFNRRVEFKITKCDNKTITVEPITVPDNLKIKPSKKK